MIKLGVLGSTKGTDLEKIIETEKLGQLNATISVVISNRKNAYILERAKTYNIPNVYISHKNKKCPKTNPFAIGKHTAARESGTCSKRSNTSLRSC